MTVTTAEAGQRLWRSARALDPTRTLAPLQHGAGDPTGRRAPDGSWWRAALTPAGPVTWTVAGTGLAQQVRARAWGPGAQWLLDGLPELLGERDLLDDFRPVHPVVSDAARRFPGWRVCRSRLVIDSLVPAVIEQKVTGQEAFAGYRRLVRRYGVPAPGPGADLGLLVAPSAREWAAVPSWAWLQASVDPARSRAIVASCRAAARLEEAVAMEPRAAHARLRAIPGIGVWTAAEVRQRALGDADAVSFGDYHIAKNVGWALIGREVDDEGMAELLKPYAGHRYRVTALLGMAGQMRPRHGPRMAPRTHLPTR